MGVESVQRTRIGVFPLMNRPRSVLAASIIALAAAMAGGSALGAQVDYGLNAQSNATNESNEPARRSTDDQAVDSSRSMSLPDADSANVGGSMGEDSDASSDNSMSSPADASDGTSDVDSSSTMNAQPESSNQAINSPAESATTVVSPGASAVVVTPAEPAYVGPADEPRYTPETGDAQYGSKLNSGVAPFSAAPPNRFNDATGQ
ncbi:MAG TPA: hypothetical protein VFF44_09475 [Casimicrobiaceae bacterium]|nr:hypothetical protein [Casimicrobiaceae bacterium]